MKAYIKLRGCDDDTEFDMDVTEEQFEFLNVISEKSKEVSSYQCMPTLLVSETEEGLEE